MIKPDPLIIEYCSGCVARVEFNVEEDKRDFIEILIHLKHMRKEGISMPYIDWDKGTEKQWRNS